MGVAIAFDAGAIDGECELAVRFTLPIWQCGSLDGHPLCRA
jgi:hypothetical protein